MLRAALSIFTFLARHLAMLGLMFLFGASLWTVIYFALLVLAIATDSGLGGPLSYPAGLVGIAIFLAMAGALFVPACATGRLFTGLSGCPRIVGIPVVFLTSCGLYLLLSHVISEGPSVDWLTGAKEFTLFLSLPLGIYWWATEGPGALLNLLPRLLRRSGKAKKAGEQ